MIRVFLFGLIFLLSTCNKYPDGPGFSLATKKARVTRNWKIEKFFINGRDTSSVFGAFFLKIHRDESYNFYYTSQVIGNYCEEGVWSLTDKKQGLKFDYKAQDQGNGFGCESPVAGTQNYEIRRLKSKQLWLRGISKNGDILDFHFKSYVRQY